jgi:hypothetical protein
MTADRSRYGLLVSALGAILLAVAVFLPWYGISLTATGISFVQQLGDQFASQFGNASLQSYVGELHGSLSGLAGQQLGAVSAHQVLKDSNVLLLVLAGLALLDALFPLARAASAVPDGAGGAVVLLGAIACACVVYRMIEPPTPAGGVVSLSLREGPWLALLGSLLMVVGGLWPRTFSLSSSSSTGGADLWSSLSGWTPEG